MRHRTPQFGHLFSGVTQGLRGDFAAGLASYRTAAASSPLDPARFQFDSIGAYLCLGARCLPEAISLASHSLRLNRTHAHSWRILTIAQAETGELDEARRSLHELLQVQPDLTVQGYLAGAKPDDPTRRRFAEGLRLAGLN